MKKLLLLSTCLLWSILCFPQNWFCVTETNDTRIDVDLSSIERTGTRIYCWKRYACTNEDSRREEADRLYKIWNDQKWLKYDYSLNYDVYDGKKSQTLSSIYYDTSGKSLLTNHDDELHSNYTRLIPGTVGMSIFDALNDEHLFEVDGVKYTVYIEDIPYFLYKNPRETKYLGDNPYIKLMTLNIILERLKNIKEDMNLDHN